MVQSLVSIAQPEFAANTGAPVFYRTYSRRINERRENLMQVIERTTEGLIELGHLSADEASLIAEMAQSLQALPSGRWMWVGGTPWINKPENFSGAYNCTSTNIVDWVAFGLMMDLAMMGSGTGAILEPKYINQLPPIKHHLNVTVIGEYGQSIFPLQETQITGKGNDIKITVGDSRQGWVRSYQALLELAADDGNFKYDDALNITVDVSNVRQAGKRLKGFGGVANPIKLKGMYTQVAKILNQAVGRQLTSVECCLIIDEAAATVVAGNVRRSAGMRQGASGDEAFASAKDNLWTVDLQGNWKIDPDRDALRMANHTRVYHEPPSLAECINAVRKQFQSGEGAIQYAPEAIARANRDLLNTRAKKQTFLASYIENPATAGAFLQTLYLQAHGAEMPATEQEQRLERYGLNPCGEILGSNFHCNLAEVHLNQIDPRDFETQEKAFTAGALSVAVLLNHKFTEPRYQSSRELDPIVGVSFTGLFDFFVQAFGVDWLRWWEAGRPSTWALPDTSGSDWQQLLFVLDCYPEEFQGQGGDFYRGLEKAYLCRWNALAHQVVWDYCDRHGLKRPNRCTTVQPAGTKSLLTGASAGWHLPKAQRYIRRITFRREEDVALACERYGYSIIPSQSDKDENGNLLNDPYDPRCTEWLVEIPVKVSWADLPGADEIAIEKFSVLAQFDFLMQVQQYWTTHNTSATLELRESEIEALGERIHQAIAQNEGYISAALLARFDDKETFPRMPFEPINRVTFERLQAEVLERRQTTDFYAALVQFDKGFKLVEGPAGCDSDFCEGKATVQA